MSYILDALRRAEAERQRGQLPGLGAMPTPVAGLAAREQARPMWWAKVLVAALLVAAAWGWWWRAGVTGDRVLPAVAVPAVVAVVAVAPAPGAVIAPQSVTDAEPARAAPAPSLPIVVSAPPGVSAMPAPPAATPTAEPVPVKLADLSPQVRGQWPALALGGSVWSDSPGSRFVILNGQVLREGETVVPGLVLERIGPKAALLRWRGLRVELPL